MGCRIWGREGRGRHEHVDSQARNIVAGSYSRGEKEEKKGGKGKESKCLSL